MPSDALPVTSARSLHCRAARVGLIASGLLVLTAVVVWAAVTIAGFEVEAGEEEIFAYWETASEIGNLGFYIWRSESHADGYVRLPLDSPSEQFIPSEDFGIGAFYEFVDVEATPGILYYYKVADVPANGSPGDLVGPESAMIAPPATTPPPATATSTATSTSTPDPAGTPAPSPDPSVRFWAEPGDVDAGDCTTVQWQTENVQAVFFNGTPVTGQGAQVYCPCDSQTYKLSVTYQDGSEEDFTVVVSVTGRCEDPGPTRTLSPSVLATPMPPASPTQPSTASPTSTSQSAAALPTAVSAPTVRPTATDAVPAGPGVGDSPLERPSPQASGVSTPVGSLLVTQDDGQSETIGAQGVTSENLVVEGVTRLHRTPWMLLAFAGLLGTGFLVGGVWLWRRG